MFLKFFIVFPSSVMEAGEFNFFLFLWHITSLIPIHIALQLYLLFCLAIFVVFCYFCLFTYSQKIYHLISIFLKRFMLQDFCQNIFVFDHFFVEFFPNANRCFYAFYNPGLRLNFSSFLVTFLIGACLSRALLKSQKKVSNPKSTSLFPVAKFQFISCGSLLKESMSTHLKSLQVLLIRSRFRLLPLKFSKIINWGRWSEIEVVMLPAKMLSISVADFSFTLLESVNCGVKLWLKSNSRKLYVPLFYYN